MDLAATLAVETVQPNTIPSAYLDPLVVLLQEGSIRIGRLREARDFD
jgi:hypothetical protein